MQQQPLHLQNMMILILLIIFLMKVIMPFLAYTHETIFFVIGKSNNNIADHAFRLLQLMLQQPINAQLSYEFKHMLHFVLYKYQ